MFPTKIALLALLALEATALWGIRLDTGGNPALVVYLIGHAGASVLTAAIALDLLPDRLRQPRLPAFLLVFGIAFSLPVLGIITIAFVSVLLSALPPPSRQESFQAVVMPEIDPHQRAGSGFRQAGMRAFISNARAPVATRLRALVALQHVPGNVASPLLRDVLADPSEDVRLLAYGMLDNKEKVLNDAIHAESERFRSTEEGSAARAESARRLADLYWELVYQELALGDLRTHALEQSLKFSRLALAHTPDDASLHLRLGRLLQSMGQPTAATEAYDRALTLGMPKTRIIPYLAEVAFDLQQYDQVRSLMHELGDWQSLPRLKPVISYWSRA